MDIPWLGISIGACAMVLIAIVNAVTKRGPVPHSTPEERREATMPSAEQVRYLLWGLCFPLSLLPAIWFTADHSRTAHQAVGAMYLFTAASWLVLGLVPYLWVARRGRASLHPFRQRLERHSRSSFKSLVCVWIIAIAVMLFASLLNLLFDK